MKVSILRNYNFVDFLYLAFLYFNWVNKAQIDYIIRAYEDADAKCHRGQKLMKSRWCRRACHRFSCSLELGSDI